MASCLTHLLKNPNRLTNELTVGCASYRPTDKRTEEQICAIEQTEEQTCAIELNEPALGQLKTLNKSDQLINKY